MKSKSQAILFALLLITATCANTCTYTAAQQMDYSVLSGKSCNKDTQIDFSFSQQAAGTLSASSGSLSSNTNANGCNLQFLDRNGNNLTYALVSYNLITTSSSSGKVQYTNPSSTATPDTQLVLQYSNTGTNRDVIVVIQLVSSSDNYDRNLINYNSDSNIPSSFYSMLTTMTSSSITNLASLSFLNNLDLGHFYAVQDVNEGCNSVTYLVNSLIYEYSNATTLTTTTTFTPSATYTSYTSNADKLCWGSLTNSGQFQTHIRQSYPFWVAWWGILFFWLSILFGDAITVNCFDKQFQNNIWTNWRMYSLWNLAHQEFFTRMSRTLPLYVTFIWQCCVIAILYGQAGVTYSTSVTIIQFALIGWVVSFPMQFLFGAFLTPMYNATKQKYEIKKKIKNLFDKEGAEAESYEKEIDEKDDTIYTSYYWLYMLCFACMVTFYTLSVNRMQQLPRQYYYLQRYWLAAVAVTFGLDHFFFDPLFTLILGNTAFYKFRGYFYDFQLGEIFKEIETN